MNKIYNSHFTISTYRAVKMDSTGFISLILFHRVSLVFLTFSHFYFFYFITHGPMRVISVTWKYHSFWLAPGMQIFIRCLPRRSRSTSLRLTNKKPWNEPKVREENLMHYENKIRMKNTGKTRGKRDETEKRENVPIWTHFNHPVSQNCKMWMVNFVQFSISFRMILLYKRYLSKYDRWKRLKLKA